MNSLGLITKTNNVNNMYYDGVMIDTAFLPISGNPLYPYASFIIDTGKHVVPNDSGFIGSVYGHKYGGSYAFALEGYTNCDIKMERKK